MDINNIGNQDQKFYVPQDAQFEISETAKYSKVLATLGFIAFVLLALMILFMIIGGSNVMRSLGLGAIAGGGGVFVIAIPFLVFLAALFYLMNFLFKFSKQAEESVRIQDDFILESALGNLKSYFKLSAILVIVAIGLTILTIIGLVAMGSSILSAFM